MATGHVDATHGGDKLINITFDIKIQHIPSQLWAASPRTPNPDPIIVESEDVDDEVNKIWRVTRVKRDGNGGSNDEHVLEGGAELPAVGYFRIFQDLGARRFPWVLEPPNEHVEVTQSIRDKVWKIARQAGNHYIISPAGSKEDELFWTSLDAEDTDGATKHQVTLERPLAKRHHWTIHVIKRDVVSSDTE
ncbi:hypothetical protein BC835DRAFT_1302796 [Cytidiella melzeri]|nr:hypothetical protein BC835DRAFT_1302796 [Cytidiella melzeri]